MAKPPHERLEWIFWADRDTIILDYCRSPASFIPKAIRSKSATSYTAQDRDINLLITNDHNGLMAGVFIIRVCEWSVNFLSDVLSFRNYNPDVHLEFVEQTAMELILQQERNKKHVAYIPQQWLNNYRADTAENFMNREDTNGMGYWGARRGDFILHFAGSDNKKGDILEYSGVGEEVFDRIQAGNVLRNPLMREHDAPMVPMTGGGQELEQP
ncbi:hypothetical protein MY8738_002472 [Beauveria namnaoensis]